MNLPVVSVVKIERPADVAVREWRRISREAHRAAGEHWHQRMLPLHFRRGAAATYGYQPRSDKYLANKDRWARRGKLVNGKRVTGGRQDDLVLTGRLAQKVKEWATLMAYPGRVTVRMIGPVYATFRPNRPNGSSQPDKPKEITRVIPVEAELLANLVSQKIQEGILAIRSTKVIR